MKTIIIFFITILISTSSISQSDFLYGELNIPKDWSHKVYLSVKSNYREIDIIRESDIIATTVADSSGVFAFPKAMFTEKDQIFQIHLSPEEEEIEVFLTDLRKGHIGRNFLILIQNNSVPTRILRSDEGRLFGSVSSENKEAAIWQRLDKTELEFNSFAYSNGDKAEDFFFENYHNRLIKIVKSRSLLNQLIACKYLIIEDANLSYAYLESIKTHIPFLEEIYEDVSLKHKDHAIQLSGELLLVKTQVERQYNGRYDNLKVVVLSGIIFLLLVTIVIISSLFIRLRNKVKKTIQPDLTAQEEKIKLLIQQGHSNKEIAADLFISLSTVKTHINTLYKKEGVRTRKELLKK
ncbi:MAG: DNA-binding CsgD family transcriptional regulator [Crocinitomicaceae bacterium]|jgi:DNA-binding CsgD family transcriptional regulator